MRRIGVALGGAAGNRNQCKKRGSKWGLRSQKAGASLGLSASAKDRMHSPTNIQAIGDEIAVAWSDGAESFLRHDLLRRASPSAETQGERDVFGNQYGGGGKSDFAGVRVVGWEPVGNYAIRFDFSDGHRTGLYTFDYLRKLGDLPTT